MICCIYFILFFDIKGLNNKLAEVFIIFVSIVSILCKTYDALFKLCVNRLPVIVRKQLIELISRNHFCIEMDLVLVEDKILLINH